MGHAGRQVPEQFSPLRADTLCLATVLVGDVHERIDRAPPYPTPVADGGDREADVDGAPVPGEPDRSQVASRFTGERPFAGGPILIRTVWRHDRRPPSDDLGRCPAE